MHKKYRQLRYIFEDSIEVYEYLDGRYGAPGAKRGKKKKASREEIKKRNQWNRERKARHKLKVHFKENDFLITLTYRKEARPPDMKTAKKHFSDFMKEIRKFYKKAKTPLKWMRNIEVGPRGAWHIHLIINRIADTDLIVDNAWKHGKVTYKHLYQDGNFESLAGYIVKTSETANTYNENLVETSYSASRNLPTPEPKVKKLVRWKKKPHVPEGYYVDKNTFHESTNKHTGYKYRYYTLVKLDRRI